MDGGGDWILGGDFNSIISRKERKGTNDRGRRKEIIELKIFIEEMNLVEVPVIGDAFTWFSGLRKAMRRLDRFFLSENMIFGWRILGQHVGKRDISDHFPINIKASKGDWGPKLIRFNNCWVSHKDFLSFVEKPWNYFVVEGGGDYILKEKLKLLKGRLKWWNKEVFRWLTLKIEDSISELNVQNDFLIRSGTNPCAKSVIIRDSTNREVWRNLNLKESLLR